MSELSEANRKERIALLRREGRYSGVWFADHLLWAADEIEAAMRSKDHSIAVDDVEWVAEIFSDYVAWRRWDNMAEDKADLRMKMRGGDYDINEPTKYDCREAARAAITAIGSQSK